MTRCFVFAAFVFVAGCGSPPPRAPDPTMTYPGTLFPPAELGPDFTVEQHVEARHGSREGSFDAVLQKQGNEIVVVGLGPLRTRAFVVRQFGTEVTFEQRMGDPPPFPPRNVLVDVHRVFFRRLPVPAGANGRFEGSLDGEQVTETWKSGTLVERVFVRTDRPGDVRIVFDPGCTVDRCEPARVRISNRWFGYELTIENRNFQR